MKDGQAELNKHREISHDEMMKYIDKICEGLSKYLENNKLKVDYICPILRSGAVPAVYIANKLNIVKFLPMQIKHITHKNGDSKIETILNTIDTIKIEKKEPVFLIVDALISTGTTVRICIDEIKRKYTDAKILCVSLMKQYGAKDFKDIVIYEDVAFYYNGENNLTKEECQKLNIEYLHPLFPWEDLQKEIEHPDDLEENIFF